MGKVIIENKWINMIVTYIDKGKNEYIALIDVGTLDDAKRLARKISRSNNLITKQIECEYENARKVINVIYNYN